MKFSVIYILLLLLGFNTNAQTRKIDSLDKLISHATSDTQRINLQIAKISPVGNGNLDSAIALSLKIIDETKRINYQKGELNARIKLATNYCFKGSYDKAEQNLEISKRLLSHINDSVALAKMYNGYGEMYAMQNMYDTAHGFYNKGIRIAILSKNKFSLSTLYQNNAIAYQQESNYPMALSNYQDGLDASQKVNDLEGEAYIYLNMAIVFKSLNDNTRAGQYYIRSIELGKKLDLKNVMAYGYSNLSSLYGDEKDFKKEYDFAIKAALIGKEMGDQGIEASSLSRAGKALAGENNFVEAEKLIRKSIIIADSSQQPYNIFQSYNIMGSVLTMQNKFSEAIPFFEKAFVALKGSDIYVMEVGSAYAELSKCYEETGNFKKSLSAYKIAAEINDSIQGRDNIRKATELSMNYDFQKKQQIAKEIQEKKNLQVKSKQTLLITGLLLTLLLAIVAYRGFRNKQRANTLLHKQNQKIENTLTDLKSAQAQLIQSEKMASLGELTAGIAHEIQNPLNFVNNFSELNAEMIAEMQEEIKAGNTEEAMAISKEVKDNSEKITHHGKRADAIVKGMLQHSQKSTGIKVPTNINALADEYLRLSYHGLRAKDKNFNAEMKTEFDGSILKISIIPQDIGRVLLNLYNNAFYAVTERLQQSLPGSQYQPTVSVTTKKSGNQVTITVSDNGNGIPQNIKEKIFQPFFTTKPTGQGTGLGLSLSYDIIKAHGGELKVESNRPDPGESGKPQGSTFIIHLPV